MKFKYKKFGSNILRPVIPIQVGYKGHNIFYEVLVDSGADLCVFDSQIAEILNIDLFSGKEEMIAGITGIPEVYYKHEVTLTVGGWSHVAEVGFLQSIGEDGYGVVGQRGFFSEYIVQFNLKKEIVELKSRK